VELYNEVRSLAGLGFIFRADTHFARKDVLQTAANELKPMKTESNVDSS